MTNLTNEKSYILTLIIFYECIKLQIFYKKVLEKFNYEDFMFHFPNDYILIIFCNPDFAFQLLCTFFNTDLM